MHSPKDGTLIMQLDYHSLVVDRVIPETSLASTLAFQIPEALKSEFQFQPGQFLTLRIPREDRFSPRCYSISSGPNDSIAVTIKRVPGGFGSNWLLDTIQAGDQLQVRAPSGRFVPRTSDRPLVFFAGGSGITPMMSILRHQKASGLPRRMALFYANQARDQVIFGESLRAFAQDSWAKFTLKEWIDSECGFSTMEDIRSFAEAWRSAQFMVCGPTPFMKMVIDTLEEMGIDPDEIQTEKFQSLADEPLEDSAPRHGHVTGLTHPADQAVGGPSHLTVEVSGETHHVLVRSDETLLSAMERAGVAVPYSCREGSCGSCMGKLLEGEVAMGVTDALSDRELQRGYVLTCQAIPRASHLRLNIDA